jgi:hypothetical protein
MGIALRGHAKSWGIEGWDELSVTDLIEEMNMQEEEWARCWWVNESDPYSGEVNRNMDSFWFTPPMKVEDLYRYTQSYKSPQEVAKYYASEIREMVKGFIEKTPYLDLEECVYGNWETVMAEFLQQCPAAEVPIIDYAEIPYWHFYNRTISFHLNPSFPFSGWTEQQIEMFKEIVSRIFWERH